MTQKEKAQIRYLRSEGASYGEIAMRLEMPRETVKSFCRRNGLAGVATAEPVLDCRNCGAPLKGTGRKQPQKFCSAACRYAWWSAHRELMIQKAYYTMTCAYCGKEFKSYGNEHRKYCCHPCYIAARFGKGPLFWGKEGEKK